ncbi:hypothetical protein QOL99_14245 [Deinococcus sp. MIMF12]|uniref:Uncharacterized protein n=1 Tax=Deinococcus rhizophilus TaxID=3049544 RepID=A0ABT7JJR4_9DEIO|nr:hypothetical protein [Deinococcus rhizophilus]MDL2345299.1 hypothetical protein [Deinococcus rhizophilus]
MTDLLILLGLIGVPAGLLLGFWRLRRGLQRGSGTVDPLTGALFFGAEARGQEGLKPGGQAGHAGGISKS